MALAEQEFAWNSVGNDGSLNFLVQQVGLRLYFFDQSSDPLSSGLKSFSVDLSDFTAPAELNPETSPVSMASGKGYLFVVSPKIEPFFVEYDPDTDTITATRIYIQIRDFKGLDDELDISEEPEELSPEHHYNLKNQGWVKPSNDASGPEVEYFNRFGGKSTYVSGDDELIDDYFAEFGRYPSNAQQWWLGKKQNPDGDVYEEFSPRILGRLAFGNTPAPRGHYIVDAFNIDRSAMSGIDDLEIEREDERPNANSFFSGRSWYGLNNTLYYSQVLDHKGKAGMCYQEADPTSEEISDLIATDGGVIQIPEMAKVVRLFPAGAGLMVFATNGIWFVSGGQGGFSATDFSITKVSPIGTESPNSIVESEGQILWWSKTGIQAMTQQVGVFGPVDGNFEKVNLSEQTIQSYFTDTIPATSKPYVKGVYDPATNTVQWLWASDDSTGPYRYDRVLIFDLTLQAFYPWSISSASGRPWITGLFLTPQLNQVTEDEVVTVDGEDVEVSLVDVTVNVASTEVRDSYIKYICVVPVDGEDQYTFAVFNNTNFADWESFDSPGYRFHSYLETGYEILEDALRKKQIIHVITYFRRTEENYTLDELSDYVFDRPSSCLFRTKWDFASSSISGKWSRLVEAYRFRRLPGFSTTDLEFDTGFPVVSTKHKIRGTGRAIQFRFENSEIGKNFDLLGWSVSYSGNVRA